MPRAAKRSSETTTSRSTASDSSASSLRDKPRPARWRLLSFGAVTAIVIWLAASGAFAFYVGTFGSYNKTWGSLAAVVIMLTWLWLSSVALLLGAEINAEAERTRELRRGEPAEVELQAPAKA